jgi:putative transposase
MPRSARLMPGGYLYHVHNRAAGRAVFAASWDLVSFTWSIDDARRRCPVRILGYCLLPTEWRFLLWPEADGQVSAFVECLTRTHARRRLPGSPVGVDGRRYVGRFRAFPVQADGHGLAVLRHIDRGPVRAGLVGRAEDWGWSGLGHRLSGKEPADRLCDGPVGLPADWVEYVNRLPPAAELAALRESEERGCPFGSADWRRETAARLGLGFTLTPRGRPRKAG